MATPLTTDQLITALRGEGLDVVEIPGWRSRCRCHAGSHEAGGELIRPWGGINGITWHLTTGAANSGQAAIDYCGYLNSGRADTPGPLVQLTIDADGRVLVCSAGRSNHVGSISQAALDHMIAADFSLTDYQDARGHGVDGNTHTYGIEFQTPTTPSQVQIDAGVKVSAAICRVYSWTGQETHGHGEVADQRSYSDPNLNMGQVRQAVMARISGTSGGAGGGVPTGTVTPPPPPPAPALPVVSVSALVTAFHHDSQASVPTGSVSYTQVIDVEYALADLGFLQWRYVDGSAGTMSVQAYQRWQQSLGYRGKDADGYPGRTSLIELGRRTGRFTVTG